MAENWIVELGRTVSDCDRHGDAWCSCKVAEFTEALFDELSAVVNEKASEIHRRRNYGGGEHLWVHSCPCWHDAVVMEMAQHLNRRLTALASSPSGETQPGVRGE